MQRLRTHLFTLWLLFFTLAMGLLCSPALLFGRKATVAVIKAWARTMLFGLKVICGLDWRLEGGRHIPRGPAIIAANHQSMWETIALYAVAPAPVMVLKRELLRLPVYGWWGAAAGSIPVDRRAGAKAIRALKKAAAEQLAAGRQVIVFPEGTRVFEGESRPLQPGVAAIYLAGRVPCAPAVHDSGRFWRPPGGAASPKRPGVVTLRFLPAIPPGLSRRDFAARLDAALRGGREALRAGDAVDGEAAGAAQSEPRKATS